VDSFAGEEAKNSEIGLNIKAMWTSFATRSAMQAECGWDVDKLGAKKGQNL